MFTLGSAYFYVCAALAVCGALAVVLARNPIRSAMGLLLLILSVAGLFLALHAQFLAAVQLIVYAGAIVVLFLFVIMLLGPSATPPSDHRGILARAFGGGLFGLAALCAVAGVVRAAMAGHRTMPMPLPLAGLGGIDAFGTALFSDDLVPFEVSSALLMVAVVGAVAVAKGRQGIVGLSKSEKELTQLSAHSDSEHPGIFRHDIETGEAPGAVDPDTIPTSRPERGLRPDEMAEAKEGPR